MATNQNNTETLTADYGMSAREVMADWERRYGWYEELYVEPENVELERALYRIRKTYR